MNLLINLQDNYSTTSCKCQVSLPVRIPVVIIIVPVIVVIPVVIVVIVVVIGIALVVLVMPVLGPFDILIVIGVLEITELRPDKIRGEYVGVVALKLPVIGGQFIVFTAVEQLLRDLFAVVIACKIMPVGIVRVKIVPAVPVNAVVRTVLVGRIIPELTSRVIVCAFRLLGVQVKIGARIPDRRNTDAEGPFNCLFRIVMMLIRLFRRMKPIRLLCTSTTPRPRDPARHFS